MRKIFSIAFPLANSSILEPHYLGRGMRGDRTIAARLRAARLHAGLSQEKLGIEAGIEEATVSSRMSGYETGSHTPGPLTLERIADVLKIPAPYFYTRDETLAELIVLYGALEPGRREAVLEAVRQFVISNQSKTIQCRKR